MKWREKSIKIIIHIADAGAHSKRFTEYDEEHNDKKNEEELENLIQNCTKENITIFGYQIKMSLKNLSKNVNLFIIYLNKKIQIMNYILLMI